jgi:hypothetical protein
MTPKHQIWGTFSVKDHVREGAFVAEALMYDKLVVPVPPRRGIGDAKQRSEAEAEWERWKNEKWDPARQTQLLGILGDLAVPVEWDKQWQAEWLSIFQSTRRTATEFLARNLAFQVTGSVLLKLTPAMATGVIAVAPYDSLDQLNKDLGIQRRPLTGAELEKGSHLPGNSLTAIVGREFLVPEDPDKDDFQLLADAVSVAKSEGYREARTALHLWLKKFLTRKNETDAVSIAIAVEEMEKHIDALRKANRRQKFWSGIRRCLFVGKTVSKLAEPLHPAIAAGVEGAISVGEFVSNDMVGAPGGPDPGLPQGALFVDAQNKLGLTTKGDRAPSTWSRIFGQLG